MSILLPASQMLGDPFIDYLNVTTPYDSLELVHRDLKPLLDVIGAVKLPCDYDLYESPGKGTLKLKRRGQVGVISASGSFLSCLRDRGGFREYLGVLASYPYRVSMAHVTQDYFVPSPPAVISSFSAAGYAGEVALTRKYVRPSQVKSFQGVDLRGDLTGTVYYGDRRNADVWAKVYDKRHERESRGYPDPGPIVRVEIACQSDVGVTLKDVESPASLFFNFASRSLCESPQGVPPWSPHGEGFVLPARVDRSPMQRVESILESSHDFSRIVEILAPEFGDRAWEVVLPTLRRRFVSLLAGAL